MKELFSYFKYGFISIITSPFWLVYFLARSLFCLIIYIVYFFKATFSFFKGAKFFETNDDIRIKHLKEKEMKDIYKEHEEALNNVD